jgi:hypothetical protein
MPMLFLTTKEAGYITGQTIAVMAGRSSRSHSKRWTRLKLVFRGRHLDLAGREELRALRVTSPDR